MAIAALPRRAKLDETIRIPVTEVDKRRVYEAAAKRNLSVAELVRQAIEANLSQQAA